MILTRRSQASQLIDAFDAGRPRSGRLRTPGTDADAERDQVLGLALLDPIGSDYDDDEDDDYIYDDDEDEDEDYDDDFDDDEDDDDSDDDEEDDDL